MFLQANGQLLTNHPADRNGGLKSPNATTGAVDHMRSMCFVDLSLSSYSSELGFTLVLREFNPVLGD